jgi:hypothetical protein
MDKRTLRIEPVPATALVRVAWNGGGELPQALKGYYTSVKDAQRAIDVWSTNQSRPEVIVVPKDPRDDMDPKKLVVKTEDIERKQSEETIVRTTELDERGAMITADTPKTGDVRIDKHVAATEKRSPGRPRKE